MLRASFDKLMTREHAVDQEERERAEREQLLRGGGGGNDAVIDMAEAARREGVSLSRSHQVADELFGMGTAVLHNLQDQRDRLKDARRKLLDMANTIGLSSTLIRQIERRQLADKIIVYSGMVITMLILFGLYWYLKM